MTPNRSVLPAALLSGSLAVVFLWFGVIKFYPPGYEGITGLVQNSPLLSWVYGIVDVPTFGRALGVVEIVIGAMLLIGLAVPAAGIVGGLSATVTFVVTLTFLLTTPGVVPDGSSLPVLSALPGEFLLKDLVLLAASIVVLLDRLAASRATAAPV